MATFPLVGLRDDLGPLIKLSLEAHGVPVTAIFSVFEEGTESQFFAVFTPLTETQNLRVAYFKIFTALEHETFAPESFLQLHTIVLPSDELKEIRRVMKNGASQANLPKLAHLRDVVLQAVVDPKTIDKTGLLQIAAGKDDSYLLTFASLDGSHKRRKVNSSHELDKVLAALGVKIARAPLKNFPSTSIAVTCTLETLYRQGLV